MDKFDRKILDSLQRNSAVSRGMLAEQVGLSESQVARRRQALEQSGVIRRYRADLDALRDLVNGVLLMHQTVDRVRSEIVLEILRDDQLLVL